jgi:hypothetical protein
MKKRILSLVLCAAMLLSMCLFMGAGVTGDAVADMAETAGTVEDMQSSPAVGPILPLVVTRPQTSPYRAARAPSLADTGETQDDGLELTKTVTPKADGGYTVHLEAYTTGTVTTSTTTKPCDIVLVLDQSGSMADNFSGKGTDNEADTRQYAMKQAVNTFIDNVAKKAKDEGVEHRIAIVKFAGDSTDDVGDTTYKDGIYRYNYSQVVKELTAVNDANGANATTLKTAVNQLQAQGGTQTQNGLNHAQRLLSSVDSARDSSKVVIVFTDGMPGDSGFDAKVATSAIASAKSMKDAGVTVYTVGIFTGANVGQLYGDTGFSKNSNGNVGSYWANWATSDGTDVPAGNRFLNYVSSNFKNASEIGLKAYSDWKLYYGWEVTQNFTRDKTGYYMTASNSTALNDIFTSISQTIGSANIDLGSETVIKDIVTPYFTVPQDAGAIRLSTATYNGSAFGAPVAADSSVKAVIDPATRAVNVTGFDFNQNYVTTNAKADGTYGKKLIIEFDVSVEAGFLGGNQVPTNDGQSGIYAKGTMIKAFDVPTQDVEVKSITPTADDKTIYLGDSANLQELVHQNATFNGTNNAFVNVTYTVEDENGVTVGTYTVPAGSSSGTWAWNDAASGGTVAPEQTTTYTVTCTVSPTQSGTYESVSKDTTFTITVNTCSLTISKAVTGDGANPNQTFVFNVMKGNDLVTTVVLKAGASTTITGLAVGDYTVVEDTAWSWSYTADKDGKADVTLSSTTPNGEAGITNTYVKHDWLTSIVDVINKWTAKDNIDNTGHVPGSGTN